MKCKKCKGKGYIHVSTPVVLNWITGIIGFIFHGLLIEQRVYEKKPGKVVTHKTCTACNGTGEVES